jgi:uncharacterized protein
MMRALFWIALVVLVVMAIRSKLRAAATRSASHDAGARRTTTTTTEPAEIESEPMTRCEFCGVYFPASEAVRAEGRDYCSPAHARHTAP